MSRSKYGIRKRIRYWFDNLMVKGLLPKIIVLFIITLIFIMVVGTLASIATGDFGSKAPAGFFTTFMYVLGIGDPPTEEPSIPQSGHLYVFLMVISIFYCMLFTAVLIGLVNEGITSKVDELGTGQSDVLEEGHILILGFNDATLVLLEELIEANRCSPDSDTVVVLGALERSQMIETLKRRIGRPSTHPKTKIICRTGSIYGFKDLRRCAITSSRVIVVNAASDFESVKAIMACSHILDENDTDNDPYIIAVIHGQESISESRVAGRSKRAIDRLEILSLNEVLARIMVHTSRQPGLSDVFTELFNYADDEFYIIDSDPSFALLHGKSIAEINHYLQMSFAIGVKKDGGGILIGPPHNTVFEEGDCLIVVKENDGPLQTSEKPARKIELTPHPFSVREMVNVLVIGVQPIIAPILSEYSNYLHDGSTVYVADIEADTAGETEIPNETFSELEEKGIKLVFVNTDASRKKQLIHLLDECGPDCVLILADQTQDPELEDERIVRMLLYLREYRAEKGVDFSITCEMLLTEDKELAAATEPDDFIIGRQLAALLMAQISKNRQLASLFDILLSSEGFEIYMKPAQRYVPLCQPIDLVSAGESVADKGEILIGMRQKIGDSYLPTEINPSKFVSDMQTLRQYVFEKEDYFVVLAEDKTL